MNYRRGFATFLRHERRDLRHNLVAAESEITSKDQRDYKVQHNIEQLQILRVINFTLLQQIL